MSFKIPTAREAYLAAAENAAVNTETELEAIYTGFIKPAIEAGETKTKRISSISPIVRNILTSAPYNYQIETGMSGDREDPTTVYIIKFTDK